MGLLKHSLFEISMSGQVESDPFRHNLCGYRILLSFCNEWCYRILLSFCNEWCCIIIFRGPFQIYFCHLQYQWMKSEACSKQISISQLHSSRLILTTFHFMLQVCTTVSVCRWLSSFTLSPVSFAHTHTHTHTHSPLLFPFKVSSML